MTDIANLGFSVDTAQLAAAESQLDSLAPAAARVVSATERLEQSFTEAGGAANAAAAGVRSTGGAASAAASGINSGTRALSGWTVGVRQADAQVVAYRAHLQQLAAQQIAAGGAIRLTANEGLNFARQMQDIGVTAAMGMNPFMIAVQQGPQLFDILEQAAIRAGVTVGAVFRSLIAQAAAALLPFLPIIALVATAIATIAAGFALGARAINQHAGNIQRDLNLTKEQMERLATAGTNTAVTLTDTFHAFIDTVSSRLATAFQDPLHRMQTIWTVTLDAITRNAQGAIETIVGAFIAAPRVIGAVWRGLPGLIAEGVVNAVNFVLGIVETLINGVIDHFGVVLALVNAVQAVTGGPPITMNSPAHVTITRVNTGGAAHAVAGEIAAGVHQGLQEGRRDVQSFFHDVGQAARGRRDQRVIDAAGQPNADHAARGAHGRSGGTSQADLFGQLVHGAGRDIAAQEARGQAAALDQTAEAAAAMEYQQRLLNEAQQRGIVLTPAMTTQIDQLAEAYGRAKIAADNAVSLHQIIIGSDRQLAGLRAAHDLIGLYGEDLVRATEMQRLLNEAQQKGMTPEAIAAARATFEDRANQVATATTSNTHDQFIENQNHQAHERMMQIQAEARAVGLGTDALTAYRIEEDLLAQARQQNIDLTPAEIAAIHGIAQEQSAAENATRRMAEGVAFARDTTHGFFTDLIGNLRQGQSVWDSFANAAVNAINKIVDRLMNAGIDSLLDRILGSVNGGGSGGDIWSQIFGGGSGGMSGAAGGIINMLTGGQAGMGAMAGLYAKGDVFSKPTMFAYGQGNLGIMGEAGTEAVMPLTRGPDGSLGVQMYGAGGSAGGTVIHAPISVMNDNRVSGAVSSKDIVDLQRRSAEETTRNIKRQLPAMLQEHQNNGAVVS